MDALFDSWDPDRSGSIELAEMTKPALRPSEAASILPCRLASAGVVLCIRSDGGGVRSLSTRPTATQASARRVRRYPRPEVAGNARGGMASRAAPTPRCPSREPCVVRREPRAVSCVGYRQERTWPSAPLQPPAEKGEEMHQGVVGGGEGRGVGASSSFK